MNTRIITTYLEEESANKLRQLAKKEVRSVSNFTKKLIEEAITKEEESA